LSKLPELAGRKWAFPDYDLLITPPSESHETTTRAWKSSTGWTWNVHFHNGAYDEAIVPPSTERLPYINEKEIAGVGSVNSRGHVYDANDQHLGRIDMTGRVYRAEQRGQERDVGYVVGQRVFRASGKYFGSFDEPSGIRGRHDRAINLHAAIGALMLLAPIER
jgi:hypothetical protein